MLHRILNTHKNLCSVVSCCMIECIDNSLIVYECFVLAFEGKIIQCQIISTRANIMNFWIGLHLLGLETEVIP